jgi:methionyl-tRNA formyltransferase
LKLFGGEPRSSSSRSAPGTVLAAKEDGLEVAAGCGSVLIREMQLEGRRRLGATDFLKGYPLTVGTVLGE